jgi:hypothetical protein
LDRPPSTSAEADTTGSQDYATGNLSVWKKELIEGQNEIAAELLHLSAKTYNIRSSLLEPTTCLETRFSQYALLKNREIENLKAQIETYKAEVDLLRQENFELETQTQDGCAEDISGEEWDGGRGNNA